MNPRGTVLDHAAEEGLQPASNFFAEVTDYIGFGPRDSELLREFLPIAEPHFERITDHFYDCIFEHPQALEAISGGNEQVQRLKRSLVDWMLSGLRGPHDEEFCKRRARIGHIHVRIGLPQRYMVTAMNVMRLDFREVANRELTGLSRERLDRLHVALDRLFDLELAIMLETYKLEVEERLRRRERLATIGQLAASIGHDLRNPLSVMESSLYILRRRVSKDERASKHVDKIAHQIDECDAIITHLLEMARNRPPRREQIVASALIDSALETARVPARIEVRREGIEGLQLWADAALLKQALVNLFINAVQAQHDGGEIVISAEVHGPEAGEPVELTLAVADAGAGFDADTLPMIFEPLVTTKASGTGLGLALVKSVVERHGGRVSAENRQNGGAVVKLRLPAAVATPP